MRIFSSSFGHYSCFAIEPPPTKHAAFSSFSWPWRACAVGNCQTEKKIIRKIFLAFLFIWIANLEFFTKFWNQICICTCKSTWYSRFNINVQRQPHNFISLAIESFAHKYLMRFCWMRKHCLSPKKSNHRCESFLSKNNQMHINEVAGECLSSDSKHFFINVKQLNKSLYESKAEIRENFEINRRIGIRTSGANERMGLALISDQISLSQRELCNFINS